MAPSFASARQIDVDGTTNQANREIQNQQEEASRQADAAFGQARDQSEQARRTTNEESQEGQAAAQEAGASILQRLETVLKLGSAIVGGAVAQIKDWVNRVGDAANQFLNPPAPHRTPTSGNGGTESQGAAIGATTYSPALMWVAASTGAAVLVYLLLKRALVLGLVPLLSRISHGEIYDNTARRSIHDLVVAEAGLCLNDIVARTGYSRNAVSYHLFVLEKEEEIVSVKDGKYRRYFTRNGRYVNGAKNVVAALRNETTLKFAQTVVARPGAIQRDLCVALGSTPSATCWHAKRLLDLGVIRKERAANTVQYFPGEALNKYDLSEFGLRTGPAPSPPPVAFSP